MTAQLRPPGGRPRPGLHRHQWELVDQIGCVCTYQCPCGKSKTRIRDVQAQDQAQDQARDRDQDQDQPAA
jgi:hypothetical protein